MPKERTSLSHFLTPSDATDTAWVAVTDRLPDTAQSCDWLFPKSALKGEHWILCSECILTASVPGTATHWRPAQALPVG